MWLEAALRLPRLQELIIHPTTLNRPIVSRGYIYYDYGPEGDPDEGLEEFASNVAERFHNNRAAPFKLAVLARTLGP